MVVQQTEELEGFHFKSNRSVDEEQSQVCDFRNINHGLHVGGTFEKGDSLVAVGAQRDCAFHISDLLLCKVLNK